MFCRWQILWRFFQLCSPASSFPASQIPGYHKAMLLYAKLLTVLLKAIHDIAPTNDMEIRVGPKMPYANAQIISA